MYCDWPIFRRCCFCLPLRRGVLAFGYLNLLFSFLMIGVYIFTLVETPVLRSELVYHGASVEMPAVICILIYCCEVIFNALLLYGAHKKLIKYVKIYYYFAIATTLSSVLMGIIEIATMRFFFMMLEIILFGIVGLVLQLYLLMLVSSLIKKLEEDGTHTYENQLHQFINGEMKIESNGIYNPSTIPNDAVAV